MDNDFKHTLKVTLDNLKTKKLNILEYPCQSPDLNPAKHAFQLVKTELKAERLKQLKVAVKVRQSIQGGNPEFVDIHGFQTSSVHLLQRIFIRV